MKLSIAVFAAAALASVSEAIHLKYYASDSAAGFVGSLTIENHSMNAYKEGGSSDWVNLGIWRHQLRNAHLTDFEWCMDVQGIQCKNISGFTPVCDYNYTTSMLECITIWEDKNWSG